jgi:hypothetical protein
VNERRIQLFREMSELTAPECAKNCKLPHTCCDEMYCDMTQEYALEQGVKLEPTGHHPTLKFMGPDGCIVEPHLRPWCTLHTCAINNLGFKPGDPEWTARDFKIRNEIDDIDFQESKS